MNDLVPECDQVDASSTPTTLELDIVKDAGIRLFGAASRKSCERVADLFGQVWNGLPKMDRHWMKAKWQKEPRYEDCLLYVDYGPDLFIHESCACVFAAKQEMWLEGRAFERSDDDRVKAIIAHELGHLRGYADPMRPDHSEAIADLYATRVWGYKLADGVYTTDECLTLEKLARSLGLNWQVFLWHCHLRKYFIYLRPNEKLRCQCINVELGYDFKEAERTIRRLAPEKKSPGKKRRLKAK